MTYTVQSFPLEEVQFTETIAIPRITMTLGPMMTVCKFVNTTVCLPRTDRAKVSVDIPLKAGMKRE